MYRWTKYGFIYSGQLWKLIWVFCPIFFLYCAWSQLGSDCLLRFCLWRSTINHWICIKPHSFNKNQCEHLLRRVSMPLPLVFCGDLQLYVKEGILGEWTETPNATLEVCMAGRTKHYTWSPGASITALFWAIIYLTPTRLLFRAGMTSHNGQQWLMGAGLVD